MHSDTHRRRCPPLNPHYKIVALMKLVAHRLCLYVFSSWQLNFYIYFQDFRISQRIYGCRIDGRWSMESFPPESNQMALYLYFKFSTCTHHTHVSDEVTIVSPRHYTYPLAALSRTNMRAWVAPSGRDTERQIGRARERVAMRDNSPFSFRRRPIARQRTAWA